VKTSFDLWMALFEEGHFSEDGGELGWWDWQEVVAHSTEPLPPDEPWWHAYECAYDD